MTESKEKKGVMYLRICSFNLRRIKQLPSRKGDAIHRVRHCCKNISKSFIIEVKYTIFFHTAIVVL